MYKSLLSLGFSAALLAGLSLDASADRGRRGEHWDRGDQHQRWDRRQQLQHWRNNQQRRWRKRGFTAPHRFRQHRNWGPAWRWQDNRHWQNNRHWRDNRHWRSNGHWGNNFGGGWPFGSIGSAAIGAAITYTLINPRDDHRHCNHAVGLGHANTAAQEVVACFRMERMPDGRERRVDLPLGECF